MRDPDRLRSWVALFGVITMAVGFLLLVVALLIIATGDGF